jgi:Tc toxin complex TcA C-terminal TcB-binding domain/Neuraminidase-like domain/Salmonella virulence plasmid 28.1kDa A protein
MNPLFHQGDDVHQIQAPIKPDESGSPVANLQATLSLLLDGGVVPDLDPAEGARAEALPELGRRFAEERARSTYGKATRELVRIVQVQHGLGDRLGGAVDERTAAVLNGLLEKLGAFDDAGAGAALVKGRVTLVGGAPAVGFVVRAHDRDLRTSQELGGEAVTDADGRYEIRYAERDAGRAEAQGADLVVRVYAAGTDRDAARPLAESPTLFNAPAVAEIDLEVLVERRKRPSEFERHVRALEPLLAGQGADGGDLPLAELTEADVDFLAADTGIAAQHVAWLGRAFALSQRSASSGGRAIPASLFYGWLRKGRPDTWEQLAGQPISALRTDAHEAVDEEIVPAKAASGLERSLAALPSVERDSLQAAVRLTGLGTQAVRTVLRRAGAASEVTDPLVSGLVEEGAISTGTAHRVGLALAAHDLAAGDEAVMAAILRAQPARFERKKLQRARDLAVLDPPELERTLDAAGVAPPDGSTLPEYAARLADEIAERFPTEALLRRAGVVPDDLRASLEQVVAPRRSARDRLARNRARRNGDESATRPDRLRQFVNLHPGLRLDEVIENARDADSALATISKRVGWVERVRRRNPDLDLLAVDYLPGSLSLQEVNFDRLPEEARSMVAESMKAYQRIQSAGAGGADGIRLLEAGYASATAMAQSLPSEIAERTGLSAKKASAYHATAERKANEAALTWIAIHDLERDARIMRNGALPQPSAYLGQLKGYADLFGTPIFCRCEHCQSVLGPAAYLVDLMFFVERHVLEPSFKAHGGERHGLHLRSRRPDLWELELTCENTTTVVPTLDLVNELLERYIVATKGLPSAAKLYERLAAVDHSIRLPFSLPLEQLSLWLGHLGVTRAEIADALLLSPGTAGTRARIRLRMLPEHLRLITTSRLGNRSAAAMTAAKAFYSAWLKAEPTLSTIAGESETRAADPVAAVLFSRAIGTDTEAVAAVFATAFVTGEAAGAPPPVKLEGRIGTKGGVQNDTELVTNLTSGRLDRFERFVRLWQHVPWTVAELGYVLERLFGTGPLATGSQELDEAVVVALARLVAVQEELGASVEVVLALCDEVPAVELREDRSLAERLFDPPLDPNLRIDSSSAVRARLAAALQIDDETLTRLTDSLKPCLGGVVNGAFVQGLWLSSRNLSLLVRYARLARLLKLTVPALLQTVALTPSIEAKAETDRCIQTLDDLTAVLEVHRALLASGATVAEIQLITGRSGGVVAAGDEPEKLAGRIVGEIGSDKSLQLSSALFTQIGLTEAEAAGMIADNCAPVGGPPAILEPIPGTDAFRIRRVVGPDDVAPWFRFDPEPRPEGVEIVAEDVFAIARRGGEEGFAAEDLVELGLSSRQAAALVDENLSAAADDGKPFELAANSAPPRYRLRDEIDQAEAVEAFGGSPDNVETARAILTHRARDIVTRRYADVARDVYRIVRQAGEKGFDPAAFTALGLSAAEAAAFVTGNLGPTGPFEEIQSRPGAPVRYRRRARLSEAAAIASFGAEPGADTADFLATKRILTRRAIDLVLRHLSENVLAAKASTAASTTPERTRALVDLALPSGAAKRQALVDALQGGPPQILSEVLARLVRYAVLFRSAAFDAGALAFVRAHPEVFALADPPTAETIRRVSLYATLAGAPDTAFAPGAPAADARSLQDFLTGPDGVVAAKTSKALREQIAKALKSDERRIGDALGQIVFPPGDPPARIDELDQLAAVLALMRKLGPPAEILRLSVSEDPAELARASDGALAAIEAKYTDKDALRRALEPFQDTLRSRTRDGLVEYLLSAPDDATTDWRQRFTDANDLYRHFLIDVMAGGCARTSRIVAATTSLQLYVQRVIMNLEHTPASPTTSAPVVAALFADARRQAEWAWRKSYQVWVANRKVFLYPETYLEPGLRDDKTPIFRDLEDTLLQQEISDSTADAAYGKYLIGLEAVARLTIAGACYDAGDDVLHLFGASHNDPPIFHYRRIDDAKSPNPIPSPWQPLTLQITTRHVSPVLYEGRLYVFWLETATRTVTTFADGTSDFTGYQHAVRVRYSMLRADREWTPPHGLHFWVGGATEEARIVSDPKIAEAKQRKEKLDAQIAALDTQLANLKKPLEDAAKEAEEKQAAVTAARNELNQPLPGVTEEEVAIAIAATAAAATAGFFASPAGPIAAAAAALAAWLEVVSRAVGATVAGLEAAGVRFDDRLITARRKVKLWLAIQFAAMADSMLANWRGLEARLTREREEAKAAIPVVSVRWDRSGRDHTQPLDNYRPAGWEWERVYPDVVPAGATQPATLRLVLVPTNDSAAEKGGPGSGKVDVFSVDLFSGLLRPIPASPAPDARKRPNNANGRITLTQTSHQRFAGQEFFLASLSLHASLTPGVKEIAVAPPDAVVQAVNGDPLSVIVEIDGDAVWARSGANESYSNIRLGTTVVPGLTTVFGQRAATGLLNRKLQSGLTEAPSKIAPVVDQAKPDAQSPFHRANQFLTYFRETFFHIPFSIADHLNSQQRFAECQRWYHRIFDPTAADGLAWRYREFQRSNRTTESLRATLTDAAALAAYRADPFNPHAIARLRPGAYEKVIVMKYVDNLLDWGDTLFARFTMESVNEAMMLYVMAADILGPRPVELGPCGETSASPRTYAGIAPLLRPSHPTAPATADFLIEELELLTLEAGKADLSKTFVFSRADGRASASYASTAAFVTTAGNGGGAEPGFGNGMPPEQGIESGSDGFDVKTWKVTEGVALEDLYSGVPIGGEDNPVVGGAGALTLRISGDPADPPDPALVEVDDLLQKRKFGQVTIPKGLEPSDFTLDIKYGLDDVYDRDDLSRQAKLPDKIRAQAKPSELARARLVFCIPPNEELKSCWDRTEDRLNKIRNCMDIAGVRRRLELFAPEIDPRMLVRMRAAGLSLDDVMNVTSGNVPPYRFTYLIEKAKQHASLVQSFGSQVLSALEKRDSEELNRLRTVHEQNLAKLRSRTTTLEIDAAEDTIASLQAQRAAAQHRQEHFSSLSTAGLLASESKHQQLQEAAAGIRTMAGVSQVLASVLSIIPDLGAPTAMKFGGSQLGAAARSMAESFNAAAAFTEMGASMAGVEASNRRRDQEWRYQAETAKRDVAQIDKQLAAAGIRRDIAIESQKIHERSLEQVEEIFDFLRDRFTSFGRFTWLSAELQKLHRMAFNAALSMARLAEQAYRFERPDEAVKEGLTGNYWDAGNAGLLAGDRLMLDLHSLERSFTETNYRTLELEQSFSLARFDPDALSRLKAEGACDFEIPEWYFDLTYAGHYRRRIKAVRLTVPCVVGPHVNIGATLRLTGSHIRMAPRRESLVPVPLRHVTAIAASMGQNDGGVFELSFRDERYMPFEGAGVNSRWQLTLPQAVKPFDYGTISDMILRINYTAEENSSLREQVEGANGVVSELTRHGVTRVLSLRNDFPDAWNKLLEDPRETALEISDLHVPFFLSAFELEEPAFDLLVEKSEAARYPTATFDGIAPDRETDEGEPEVAPPGPDEESGLWRLLRTPPGVAFVGSHTIGLQWPADEPKPDDILIRAVLKRAAT